MMSLNFYIFQIIFFFVQNELHNRRSIFPESGFTPAPVQRRIQSQFDLAGLVRKTLL